MLNQDELLKTNKNSWEKTYSTSRRRRYPDLVFIHLLMNYAYNSNTTKKALVIGPGDGTEVFALTRLNIEVHAMDISENAIKRLETFVKEESVEGQVKTYQGDQRDLSKFSDNSFDLVTSWSVISYLNEADGQLAVDQIFKVLKPGGKFVGILESADHSGYRQEGVKKLSERTYWIPPSGDKVASDMMMTYYAREDAVRALQNFGDLKLSHRVWEMPPDAKFRVGQWLFCCTKPA